MHNPFAQESDVESSHHESQAHQSRDESRGGSRAPQSTVMNMSADFDDAWVSLPTSNFFTASTPPRRTGTEKEQPPPPARGRAVDSSPQPPPISAKKASVQKFSPQRFDTKNREMDYTPPSTERRGKQSERGRAYDEKRVDQAASEE